MQEMARTQKNKATEYHLGLLKAKLARYRAELLEGQTAKSSKPGEGFDVAKAGYGRAVLIGFPSVGKSTLLTKVTNTESAAANYAFTTLVAVPGVLDLDGAKVQLLDLPGIIEGASSGRGRGRQVVAVAKARSLSLLRIWSSGDEQREQLEHELEEIGIRLNRTQPDIVFKSKTAGGITINTTVPLTRTDERTIRGILQSYKVRLLAGKRAGGGRRLIRVHWWQMHNADVMIREDVGGLALSSPFLWLVLTCRLSHSQISTDDFVDVILGNRKYVPCLYVYNKIDAISLEEVDRLARQPHTVVISCELDLNLEVLKQRIWQKMGFNRIYTKKRGERPDLGDPLVIKTDASIEAVCDSIHRSLVDKFNMGQIVQVQPTAAKGRLDTPDDVVSIVTKV
ncbi:SPOSA6832_01873, partial [Sporobolomyces salmonicolor]